MNTAYQVAASVTDPELPMLTLADLGVLRDVSEVDGQVTVRITPTYSGCPAMETMRADLEAALRRAGFQHISIDTALHPAWTTDWISDNGKRKLAAAGIAPPGPVTRHSGAVPLNLHPPTSRVRCPHCGSADTEEQSRFSATACRALRRCRACQEPFEHVKEI